MTTDSDPPGDEFDDEEKTDHGVEDVPKPMRTWTRTTSRRIRTVEKHFEKGGMVFDLHSDWSAVTKSFNFWIKVGPVLGALLVAGIGALMWLIHASAAANAPPPPAPPSAQDIAREVLKQQQK